MVKAIRNTKLETRTARSKLKPCTEPYWLSIGKTIHLGYRRGVKDGSWIVRVYRDGKYTKKKLAKADDTREANNGDVLDFYQAQEKARAYASALSNPLHIENRTSTVADAISNYLHWYQTHRKGYDRTCNVAQTHILPALGDIKLCDLTPILIRKWHEKLAEQPVRLRSSKTKINYAITDNSAEALRKRKATANRILTVLKAALNHAWRDGYIERDDVWRKVKPFHNVDAAKISYLSIKECERLINTCEPDFRELVQAALLTGCRYGELINLTVQDFSLENSTLHVRETKNGKARYVPLTEEGVALFQCLVRNKTRNQYVLLRHDNAPWGRSHQARRLADACDRANIKPAISFHTLRHTYASLLASRGVSLQVIAELLGHADTRITSRHYAHLLPSYVSKTLRENLPQFMETPSENVVDFQIIG